MPRLSCDQNTTRFRFSLFLAAMVLLVFSAAASAQVVLTFGESIPAPNRVSKQFCADPNLNRGVEFHSRPSIVTAIDVDGNTLATSSPPQVLLQSASQEFSSREVLVASFTEGQTRVGLMLGLDRDWGFAVTARLRAFDSDQPGTGTELTLDPPPSVLLGTGPAPVATELAFETPDGSATIRRIELSYAGPLGQTAIEMVDDLSFSSIGPPCAIDAAPPGVIINEPVNGQMLSSTEYLLNFSVTDDVGVATLTVVALDFGGNAIESYVVPAPSGTAFNRQFRTYAMDGMAGLRIIATDFAGNNGSDSVAFNLQLPGPDLNLWVQGMEITQAIQADLPQAPASRARFATEADIRSPVPLIAGKRTIVRLYPGIEDAAAPVVGAHVSLHCFSVLGLTLGSGTRCDGPLQISPEAPGAIIDPALDNSIGALRLDATRSFNFVLPDEWTSPGEQRFLVGHIGAAPLLPECAHLSPEKCDDGANFFVYDLGPQAFQAVPPMQVQPLFYCVRRSDSVAPDVCDMVVPTATAAETLLDQIFLSTDWDGDAVVDRFFTNTFPIADMNAGISIAAPIMGPFADGNFTAASGAVDQKRMEVLLADVCRRADLDAVTSGQRRYHIAFIAPPAGPDGIARIGGFCSVVKMDITVGNNRVAENDYCRNCPGDPVWNINFDVQTVNHELGHNMGNPHASCDHNEGDGGGCAAAPEEFPCPHGGICIGGIDTRDVFVFEPYLMRALPPVLGSAHAHDLMSYGPEPMWVSPHTYNRVFHRLRKDAADRLTIAMAPAVSPSLFVSGFVSEDGSAELAPLLPVTADPEALPGDPDSGFALELRDAAGQVLERRDLTVAETSETVRLFSALVPQRAEAVRLVLLENGVTLKERERSLTAPEAVLIEPSANAVWRDGPQTVNWQASDADGDALSVVIQYSSDAGNTWHSLGEGGANGSLTVEAGRLAAGPRLDARIRMLVSDGFRGTTVISDPFTVLDEGPQVRILSPDNGAGLDRTTRPDLAGAAWDAGDGDLPPKALSWRSDRDGPLGQGYRLRPRLSPGGHFITLTAVDSDGNVASDILRLIVRDVTSRQPVADAGADIAATVGASVKLDGTGSYDPAEDELRYEWRVVSAPVSVTSDPSEAARPNIVLPVAGKYVFELRVSTGIAGSYPDQVTVLVE